MGETKAHYHAVQQALAPFGFSLRETGGWCAAWAMEESTLEILIAVAGDGRAPTRMRDPVSLGVYDDENSEPVLMLHFSSVRALVTSLQRGQPRLSKPAIAVEGDY